jgi:hypothetical protein
MIEGSYVNTVSPKKFLICAFDRVHQTKLAPKDQEYYPRGAMSENTAGSHNCRVGIDTTAG